MTADPTPTIGSALDLIESQIPLLVGNSRYLDEVCRHLDRLQNRLRAARRALERVEIPGQQSFLSESAEPLSSP